MSEREWEAQQLGCNYKSGGVNKNMVQSLASCFLWIISICQWEHNSAWNGPNFSIFCVCFCLLLWKETPLFRSYLNHQLQGDIWAQLSGHTDYLNSSVTMQILQTKVSCNTFFKITRVRIMGFVLLCCRDTVFPASLRAVQFALSFQEQLQVSPGEDRWSLFSLGQVKSWANTQSW